jgi:UDP-N-acetylmuramyl tripeptide synthase
LHTGVEVTEQAFAFATAGTGNEPTNEDRVRMRDELAGESNPGLRALAEAAAARGVTLLVDDESVSLGTGRGAATWPARHLPDPAGLDWQRFRDVPTGLVTGTNGKTTTVRFAKQMLQDAGLAVGVSSTDWIAVDDRVIDRGDWSGPGGARKVLRQPVDAAILETARGGLLRRGLGVTRADAALITNLSADHLGDFGSRNLVELLQIKWLVSRAVEARGTLILNAEDEQLVAKAQGYRGRTEWFALDADNPVVTQHCRAGGRAWVRRGAGLLAVEAEREEFICDVHDVPLTMGGAARHNVANALAAAALAAALGAGIANIRHGLTSMTQAQNPGRCNIYEIGKRKVLVDFAHNPGAMRALLDMARSIPARRRAICFGQAGDRPDELIQALARDAWAIGLDRVYVSELAPYYRGRRAGEVFTLLRDELLKLGIAPEAIEHHMLESESLSAAMNWAEDGDLVIMLALGGFAPVDAQLRALIRETRSA